MPKKKIMVMPKELQELVTVLAKRDKGNEKASRGEWLEQIAILSDQFHKVGLGLSAVLLSRMLEFGEYRAKKAKRK